MADRRAGAVLAGDSIAIGVMADDDAAGAGHDGVEVAVFEFAAQQSMGTNVDAVQWIRTSALPDGDRVELLYLVARFPGLAFAREHGELLDELERQNRFRFPEWFRVLRTTVGGLRPQAGVRSDERALSVRFDDRFYYFDDEGLWLGRDEVPEPWYDLFLAGYANAQDRDYLYEGAGMYPVGRVFGENDYLAIDIRDPAERRVYRLNLEDLWDNRSDGVPERESSRPVFASYPQMLARIDDVRLPDGTVVAADPAGVVGQVLDLCRAGNDELRKVHELLATGERDAARDACQLLAAGHGQPATAAMVLLSVLAETAGDQEQAGAWWQQAAQRDPDRAAAPLLALGEIAKNRHDRAGAERWLRRLAGGGYPQAALAAAHLGELCFWLGDSNAALDWYGRTLAATEDPDLIAEAAQRSGEILTGRGEHEAAAPLLRRARDTGRLTFVDGVAVFP